MLRPAGGDLSSWFVTVPVRSGLWLISEPGHVQSYLIEGADRAILIDTGTSIAPIAPVVRRLTTKPIEVVLTHNHFDHIGGNADFAQIAIHPAGVAGLRDGRSAESLRGYIAGARGMLTRGATMRALDADGFNFLHPEQIIRPFPDTFDPEQYAIAPSEATATLEDGQLLDLGGRTLEVIYTPGHSPDGICLLDRAGRILFTADTVYAGPLYAQTPGADLTAYLTSLRRLEPLIDQVDLLLPSHNRVPLDPPIIREMIAGFEMLVAGRATVEETVDSLGRRTRSARFGRFSVLLPI
ncbi:MAG TPA: MBL fold metallo-hydrolase [Thermomicrobiales bacterium]|jgi:glyoxylase-like metal-dependent hydrolase (beta-lactamase superfamily II)